MFKVGMKVVCIQDDTIQGEKTIYKNETRIISEIKSTPPGYNPSFALIFENEKQDCCWCPWSFEPLTETTIEEVIKGKAPLEFVETA